LASRRPKLRDIASSNCAAFAKLGEAQVLRSHTAKQNANLKRAANTTKTAKSFDLESKGALTITERARQRSSKHTYADLSTLTERLDHPNGRYD
jgi:hypothetical protein